MMVALQIHNALCVYLSTFMRFINSLMISRTCRTTHTIKGEQFTFYKFYDNSNILINLTFYIFQ